MVTHWEYQKALYGHKNNSDAREAVDRPRRFIAKTAFFKSSGVRTLTAVVHVEADVHISNESIHVQHAPPAPLAALGTASGKPTSRHGPSDPCTWPCPRIRHRLASSPPAVLRIAISAASIATGPSTALASLIAIAAAQPTSSLAPTVPGGPCRDLPDRAHSSRIPQHLRTTGDDTDHRRVPQGGAWVVAGFPERTVQAVRHRDGGSSLVQWHVQRVK